MKAPAVLLVASLLAGTTVPRSALASPDQKAAHHQMQHQQNMMQQEARRQQEAEKKLMEHQKRMVQEQMNAERKFMEQQQKAFQQQQKMMHEHQQKAIHEQQKMLGRQDKANIAHATARPTPVYHYSHPYYGHHPSGHHSYRTSYRHYRQMPAQHVPQDPQMVALQKLKQSLDAVPMGHPATPAEKAAIKNALMRVVQVPRVPTVASIQTLAGHLADGLANRGNARAETGPMALTLRGAMNSTELPNIDLTEIMNEHRAALKAAKVRPAEITAVMDSLKSISNQERAHR